MESIDCYLTIDFTVESIDLINKACYWYYASVWHWNMVESTAGCHLCLSSVVSIISCSNNGSFFYLSPTKYFFFSLSLNAQWLWPFSLHFLFQVDEQLNIIITIRWKLKCCNNKLKKSNNYNNKLIKFNITIINW